MGKFQFKASAYHLTLKEVKKLFFVTHSFRDRSLLKNLFWAGLRIFSLTFCIVSRNSAARDRQKNRRPHYSEWVPELASIVIFGGIEQFGPPSFPFTRFNKTWQLEDHNWIEINVGNKPAPRNNHVIAYDLMRSTLVVQGGNIGGNVSNETWELSLLSVIEIDIKPQSCPNPLNTKSKGVLPVAILGTSSFDATNIDVSTLQLEGVAPLRSDIEDVATPVANRQDDCDCTSDGPDGFADIILKFDTQDIVGALGAVNDGDEVPLTLTGNLNDGTPVEGLDCVVIKKKGK